MTHTHIHIKFCLPLFRGFHFPWHFPSFHLFCPHLHFKDLTVYYFQLPDLHPYFHSALLPYLLDHPPLPHQCLPLMNHQACNFLIQLVLFSHLNEYLALQMFSQNSLELCKHPLPFPYIKPLLYIYTILSS